jgi:hypothetical protein
MVLGGPGPFRGKSSRFKDRGPSPVPCNWHAWSSDVLVGFDNASAMPGTIPGIAHQGAQRAWFLPGQAGINASSPFR